MLISWLATSLTPTIAGDFFAMFGIEDLGEDGHCFAGNQPDHVAGASRPRHRRQVGRAFAVVESDFAALYLDWYSGRTERLRTSPSRFIRTMTGVAARQPSICLPATFMRFDLLTKRSSRFSRLSSGYTLPSTARIAIPGPQNPRGRGALVNTSPTVWVGIAGAQRQHEENREGKRDVDRRPRPDHHDPLPDRLFVIGAVLFLRAAICPPGACR